MFLHIHNVKCPPAWAFMNRGNFCAYNPSSQTLIITIFTTNQHVQIMRLRESRPCYSPLCIQIRSSTNRPSPLARGAWCSFSFFREKRNTKTLTYNHAISVNSVTRLFSSAWFFFRFEFSRKNLVCLSFSVLCIIFTHTLPTSLLSLVPWIDRPITCGGKSPPH